MVFGQSPLPRALRQVLGQQPTPTPTAEQASIGAGTQTVIATEVGSTMCAPINSTNNFTVDWGPLTLVSNSTPGSQITCFLLNPLPEASDQPNFARQVESKTP